MTASAAHDNHQRQSEPAQPHHAHRMQDVEGNERQNDQDGDPQACNGRR